MVVMFTDQRRRHAPEPVVAPYLPVVVYRVQIRDARHRDRILVNTTYLPFDPRLSKRIRIRDHRDARDFRAYEVVDFLDEVVVGDPAESGIVLYVH